MIVGITTHEMDTSLFMFKHIKLFKYRYRILSLLTLLIFYLWHFSLMTVKVKKKVMYDNHRGKLRKKCKIRRRGKEGSE